MLRKIFFLVLLLSAFSALADGSADLQVELVVPTTIRPGETLHATATITNAGPTAAENVRWSLSRCQQYENIGTLQPGEKRVYPCSFEIPLGEHSTYVIVMSAGAMSESTPDPQLDNNYVSASTDLITLPDLRSFISRYAPLVPGEPFAAEVGYMNVARVPTERAILTITAPEKFGKVPEFCTVEGNRARCDVGAVPGDPFGEWKRFVVEIIAPDISAHEFVISLETELAEGDAGPSNDRTSLRVHTYRTFYATEGPESLANAIHEANASCTDFYPCLVTVRGAEAVTWTLREPLPALAGRNLAIDGLGRLTLLGHELEQGLGIVMPSACHSTIRGLTLRGFRTAAIAAATNPSDECRSAPWQIYRFIEQNTLTDNGVGVHLDGAFWHVRANVIERSARSGIRVESGLNRVVNNVIRDSGASGVFIGSRASGTDVDDNEIARNAHAGVAIAADAQHVAVNGNSIYGNGGLAIDWGIDGPTPEGPVPAPLITDAYYEDGFTIIEGTLRHPTYLHAPRLQFYAGDKPGDAAQFLGKLETASDDRFRFVVAGDLRGKWVAGTRMRIQYYGWLREPRPDADTGYSYTTSSELGNTIQVR